MSKRAIYVVIERDGNGVLIGEVPQLKSCHSYGNTLDELMANMKEVILLCLDDVLDVDSETEALEFVGIQRLEV